MSGSGRGTRDAARLLATATFAGRRRCWTCPPTACARRRRAIGEGTRPSGSVRALSDSLHALSRRQHVTPFVTLLAAFTTLLHRYAQQDDVVVGTPVAGRTRVETEGVIGPFVNTLALRSDLSGDPSFRTLLKRVRDVVRGARAHQDLPFEKLVQELRPARDLSRNPLFQVMFTIQNVPKADLRLGALDVARLDVEIETSRFDLTLYLTELEPGLEGVVRYATDLFTPPTISRMLSHLEVLLGGIAADPDRRVSELPLLTEAERRRMGTWNDTREVYPRHTTLHRLFEAQVERTPDAPAVIEATRSLSYRALNRRANRLARHLEKPASAPARSPRSAWNGRRIRWSPCCRDEGRRRLPASGARPTPGSHRGSAR